MPHRDEKLIQQPDNPVTVIRDLETLLSVLKNSTFTVGPNQYKLDLVSNDDLLLKTDNEDSEELDTPLLLRSKPSLRPNSNQDN